MTDPSWMDADAEQRVRAALRAAHADDTAMPADVAARLHARLSVETAAPAEETVAEVTTLPVSRGRWRPSTATMSVAAGIVAVVVAAGVITVSHHHGSSHPSSAAAAGSAASAPLDTTKTRKLADAKITDSGAVLADQAAVTLHVRELVGAAGAADSQQSVTAPEAQGAPGTLAKTVKGGLAACLASLDSTQVPLAVDEVTYQGKDALVAVYPHGSKATDVYVFGASCGDAKADGLLAFFSVPLG